MSNNIYDILKNFNNLDSVKNMLNEGKTVCKSCGKAKCKCVDESKGSKPDFLDMDKDGDKKEPMKKAVKDKSKGAIAEAVAKVEQQLTEKYMGFKKAAADNKKLGEMGPSPLGQGSSPSVGSKATPSDAATTAPRERERVISPKIDKYEKDKDSAEQTRRWMVDKESPKANDFGRKVGSAVAEPVAAVKSAWHGATDAWDHAMGNDTAPDPKPPVSVMSRSQANRAGIKEADMEEDVLTPKQKKFAKLAPPPDKITYADKIAGAKKTNEGFPTVADAKKRMDDKEGKTSHGKKTTTKTGVKHERDYDAVDKGADVDTTPKGRGRPKKDRFA